MDRNGITALIGSVTKIDMSKFPNGSVLDIMLHPSAVQGDDGLDAFYAILSTYFKKGGFAMHGNIFNSQNLRAAQETLVTFINASKLEQHPLEGTFDFVHYKAIHYFLFSDLYD